MSVERQVGQPDADSFEALPKQGADNALTRITAAYAAAFVRFRQLLDPPGDTPSSGKLLDLQMLVDHGGQERTEAEYRALYQAASFRLTRVVPTRSAVSVIEGVPV